MVSLICSTLSGVCAESGYPNGLLSFTDNSWCHFETHSSRVLQLGASWLRDCCQKPRSVAVTLFLINNSSVVVWCWTVHCFISSKLQMYCTWWWSVWKWHIMSTLVLKFQKPLGVFDTSCSSPSVIPVPCWPHFHPLYVQQQLGVPCDDVFLSQLLFSNRSSSMKLSIHYFFFWQHLDNVTGLYILHWSGPIRQIVELFIMF